MVNALVNIFIPIGILLTLSSEDRLGPIPALLLAIGIPVVYGMTMLMRTRKINTQSILGIISVLLTGIIAVFRLDTVLFPIKEAAIPIGFAVVLLATNRTRFPIVKLLMDMVQRKEKVESEIRQVEGEAVYRQHIERSGKIWAGIMTISGIMKFTLSSLIMDAPTGTQEFNTQLATYELVQIPTSMMVTMVMILSLIWYIGKGTARIIDTSPADVLRGGERLASIFSKIGRFNRHNRTSRQSA